MHAIDRRAAVTGLAVLSLCYPARAGTPEPLSVGADEGRVTLTRYAADRKGNRPSVLILHGTNGFELKPSAYARYAHAVLAKGIDAYWLRYLTEAAVTGFKNPRERPQVY